MEDLANVPNYNLLKNLNNSNYDSLILQQEMIAEGYTFHYIIDIDIIQKYCFPRGIIEENERFYRPDNYLADEQVILHSLFYLDTNSHRIIILDEYIPELIAFIKFAKKNSAYFIEKKGEDETWEKLEKCENESELAKMIENDFSKIFAEANLKFAGLEKLYNIFKKNTLIFQPSP